MDSPNRTVTIPMRLSELHPRRFFLETWRAMDEAAAKERLARAEAGKGYDTGPLVAFCLGAALLALMEYWGSHQGLIALLRFLSERGFGDGSPTLGLRSSPYWELYQHAWWALSRVLGFFVAPALVIALRRERIRDHGLSLDGLRGHAWVYALCYAVVFVCVLAVSFDPEFTRYYPFYRQSHRSLLDFGLWELLYAAQFFGLEFFFRGYWLKAARSSMGSQAIFAMVVPYVMIHFGKPLPETLAAIIAGVVLGTLAMRTGSIWSGFLIHVSVAITMDVAALVQTTGLPETLLPVL
ncbi:MAG: CPBP family intramembrane metalloprotease [Polyangiaceae bacterium]|nr:CPBP family intramembrane metalloprotease [Polyangiaceae bacterium]